MWSKFSKKSFKGDFCFAESVSEALFLSSVDMALTGGQILAQSCCSPQGVEEVGRTSRDPKKQDLGVEIRAQLNLQPASAGFCC